MRPLPDDSRRASAYEPTQEGIRRAVGPLWRAPPRTGAPSRAPPPRRRDLQRRGSAPSLSEPATADAVALRASAPGGAPQEHGTQTHFPSTADAPPRGPSWGPQNRGQPIRCVKREPNPLHVVTVVGFPLVIHRPARSPSSRPVDNCTFWGERESPSRRPRMAASRGGSEDRRVPRRTRVRGRILASWVPRRCCSSRSEPQLGGAGCRDGRQPERT